ncbi:MAG: DUF389 domain-containing protein, partial [Acidobacteria bacterium]|nr:DUF389 domain-containing protein [Acidobacteriota bacterium]
MTVLAVVSEKSQASALTLWGFRVARAKESKLIVLWVEKGSEATRAEPVDLEDEEDPQRQEGGLPEILSTLETLTASLPSGAEPPDLEVKRLVHSDRHGGVLREAELCSARWLVIGQPPSERSQGKQLGRRLFRRAPCSVLLLRPGSDPEQPCRRVLVPTAGGPGATSALALGMAVAGQEGGELTALIVEQESDDLAEEVGRKILSDALSSAELGGDGEGEGVDIHSRVELADSQAEGIERVLAEGFDLVMVGASGRGLLRRTLFGTVPRRLLSSDQGAAVAVVRGPRPSGARLRRGLEEALDLSIPQLERDDRVQLVEKLQLQSQWSFDFLALIALSTMIAALGLLQDSAAVVIGAMLVAPLMTPLLGAGMALVQGNLPLMRTAGHAIVLGFLTAVALGFLAGTVVPLPELTAQLAARGQPTLLDLGVAFFSGVAAAYCLGRPNLSAALPGVAIAAALVPPIATLGISLAMGEKGVARGAAILFGTNVVAIILGAAVSFYLAGIRTNRRLSRANRWSQAVLVVLVLASALLAVPLASFLVSKVTPSAPSAGVSEELRTTLEEGLGVLEGAEID